MFLLSVTKQLTFIECCLYDIVYLFVYRFTYFLLLYISANKITIEVVLYTSQL